MTEQVSGFYTDRESISIYLNGQTINGRRLISRIIMVMQDPMVISMKVRRPAEWRFLARSQPMMDESPTARAIRSRMPGSESSAAQLPSNEDIGS